MAALVDENTRVICQILTRSQGTFHSEPAIAFGAQIVGGATPGRDETTHLERPMFNPVHKTQANACFICVPPRFAANDLSDVAAKIVKTVKG